MNLLFRLFHSVITLLVILVVIALAFVYPAIAASLNISLPQVNLIVARNDLLRLQEANSSAYDIDSMNLALSDGSMFISTAKGSVGGTTGIQVLDASNVTLRVRKITRTMHDGANIPFWVFCTSGMSGGSGGGCTLPSPILELNVDQQANVVLDMMMAPQEPFPYQGHTIHHHGLDVNQAEDGVPDTGAAVDGDIYNFSVDSRYIGGHMYHCHVHTVKHLEMGMYGAFVVKDGNRINANGPTYDYEWNIVMSTVDPRYHSDKAILDSTIFADYIPKYFLLNGKEGLSASFPAEIFTATSGASIVIRLIGIHSVNSVFMIKNSVGELQTFVLHNLDGFKLPKPKPLTRVELSPGQTKDIMVTLPVDGGPWFPQVSYTDLRQNKVYLGGTVYTRLDF